METYFYNDINLKEIKKEHLHSLVDFINKVWDSRLTPERYIESRNRDYLNNPYIIEGGLPLAILVDKDKVIGHITSIPCKIWINGEESIMYWNAGLHLLDEYRGMGLGNVLPKKMIDELQIVTGFFVIEQQLRTHEKMGWTIVGRIPEYVKVLTPIKFIETINLSRINQMPDIIKRISKLLHTHKSIRLLVTYIFAYSLKIYERFRMKMIQEYSNIGSMIYVDDFDIRIDILWNRVKNYIKCAQVRNAAYMNCQFKKENGWIKLIYEEGKEVLGYAICAQKQFKDSGPLSGIIMTSIVDILWDFKRPDILKSIICRIENMAKQNQSDVIICSINNHQAQDMLIKMSFFRIPSTVYFAFHSTNSYLRISKRMRDWFITRGDADAAGSIGPEKEI